MSVLYNWNWVKKVHEAYFVQKYTCLNMAEIRSNDHHTYQQKFQNGDNIAIHKQGYSIFANVSYITLKKINYEAVNVQIWSEINSTLFLMKKTPRPNIIHIQKDLTFSAHISERAN